MKQSSKPGNSPNEALFDEMLSDMDHFWSLEFDFLQMIPNLRKDYAKKNSHEEFEVFKVDRVPNTNVLFFLFKYKSVSLKLIQSCPFWERLLLMRQK